MTNTDTDDSIVVKIDNYPDGITNYLDPQNLFNDLESQHEGYTVQDYVVKAGSWQSGGGFFAPDGTLYLGSPGQGTSNDLPDWTSGYLVGGGQNIPYEGESFGGPHIDFTYTYDELDQNSTSSFDDADGMQMTAAATSMETDQEGEQSPDEDQSEFRDQEPPGTDNTSTRPESLEHAETVADKGEQPAADNTDNILEGSETDPKTNPEAYELEEKETETESTQEAENNLENDKESGLELGTKEIGTETEPEATTPTATEDETDTGITGIEGPDEDAYEDFVMELSDDDPNQEIWYTSGDEGTHVDEVSDLGQTDYSEVPPDEDVYG